MTITEAMMRAARLDTSLYEEVEADASLIRQATAVVLLSAVAAGIGSLRQGGGSVVAAVIVALVGWYIWAGLSYLIGTRLLPEPQTQADFGQLLRTTGFASAPGIVRVLGIVPGLTSLAFAVAGIWMLVAMVVAVHQALDYTSTWRAVGVVVVGWLVQLVAFGIVLRGAFM